MSTQLIKKILDANLIKFGDFILKSGVKSNVYFDFKSLISYPDLMTEIAFNLGKLLSDYDKNSVVVAGVPMGAIPSASVLSTIYNIPSILIRDDQKSYGLCNIIEGSYKKSDGSLKECILIEDVVTTGGSVISTAQKLESLGIKIKEIIVILDRQQGGINNVKKEGYTIKSLFTLNDIVLAKAKKDTDGLREHPKISQLLDKANKKQSNVIISADLSSPIDILNLINNLGKYIVGVKLHFDIIDFKEMNLDIFCKELLNMKNSYDLFIIDDRKYADIGSIVVKQITTMNQLVGSELVDLITVHCITGESMISEVNNLDVGILLIHQLSTKDNLIDKLYSLKVLDIAERVPNVVGFISQERTDERLLTFSPGISVVSSSDGMGQCYNEPSELSDFYIIGRSIYQSENQVETAEMYQRLCFEKFRYMYLEV